MPAGNMRHVVPAIMILVTLAARAPAQDCFDYTTTGCGVVGTIPTGPAPDLALQDGILYVARGALGLAVYDVTAPLAPVRLAEISGLAGAVTRVEVAGADLVLVVQGVGLLLYDVTVPSAPAFAGINPGPDALTVAVGGGRIFRTEGRTAVILAAGATAVLDTVGPLLGFGDARTAAIAGDLLFVQQGDGPLVVGDLSGPDGFTEVGLGSLGSTAGAMAIAGDRLFVLVSDYGFSAGLESIDISDPTSPLRAANLLLLPLDGVDLALAGERALALMANHEGRAHMVVFDLRDPEHPLHAADLILPGDPRAVAASPAAAFVARSDGDVLVLDPGEPTFAPLRPLRAVWFADSAVDLEQGLVFVTSREFGLRIIEAATDSLVFHDASTGIWNVDAHDGRMLVGRPDQVIDFMDIGDPARPVSLAQLPPPPVPGDAASFALATDHAAVRFGPRSIVFFDLAGPTTPAVTGFLELPADAYDLGWHGDDLVVRLAWPLAGLALVTDTGGSRPRLADWLAGIGDFALASGGDMVYGASGSDLVVMRLDAGSRLSELARQPLGFPVSGLAATAGAVYVAGYGVPVQAFDRSDPLAPTLLGTTPFIASTAAVLASDAHVVFRQDYLVTVAPAACWSPPAAAPTVPAVPGLPRLALVPNPFNPAVEVRLDLPHAGAATVQVFDPAGRLVRTLARDRSFAAGRSAIRWDGRDDAGRAAAAGVYLVRARTAAGTAATKAVLVR